MIFLLLVLALSLPVPGMAQPVAGAPVDVVELGEGLYCLRPGFPEGGPPVVASVGEDGVLLVDPGAPGQAGALLAAVGVDDASSVRFIVDTHPRAGREGGFGPQVERVGPVAGGARLSTRDELRLHLNGQRILVRALPDPSGHCGHDFVVHFEDAGVLYVGDHWFDGSFPVVDLGAGGDLEGYLANIRWVLETFPPDTRVIPGHSRAGQPAVRTMADYLAWWRGVYASVGTVREAMGGGRTLEQIQAAGYGGELDRWGDPPAPVSTDEWIELVYRYYEARD